MWDREPKRTAKQCPKCWATTDRPHSPDTCIQYLRALCKNGEKRVQMLEARDAEWSRLADLVVAFRFEAGALVPLEKPSEEPAKDEVKE